MNWHMGCYLVKKQKPVKNTMINSIIDDNGNIIDKKIAEDVNRKVEWIYIHEKLYFARREVKRPNSRICRSASTNTVLS